jgi:hypothetical protein
MKSNKILPSLSLIFLITGTVYAGFGNEIIQKGNWTIYKSIDSITNKVKCVGIYMDRADVQLTDDLLSINFRGRGGIKKYKVRYDNEKMGGLRLPSTRDKKTDVIELRGKVFSSMRLRLQAVTLLGDIVDEDLDLTGIRDALDVLASKECNK